MPGKGYLFLYLTNSDLGFIENLILNPEIGSSERAKVIKALVERLEEEAKSCGVTVLLGLTKLSKVVKTAAYLNYSVTPSEYSVITKSL